MITITVNGAGRDTTPGSTVADVVAELLADRRPDSGGCAVAVNDEVVPRGDWSRRPLGDGDRIEVLTAVQGG